MKILHLIQDWVFDNTVIRNFSALEANSKLQNKFVILRASDDKVLRKIELPHLVEVVQTDTEENGRLTAEPFDIIWVHGLTDIKARFILSLTKRPIIMWSTWGYDYVRFASRWLYGPRTTRLWLKVTSIRTAVKTVLTYLVAKTPWVRFLPHLHCRFFRMVDFYSTVVPDEEVLLLRIVRPSARRLAFHYASKKGRETVMPQVNLDVKRIWIGNSATLTNNHLDVFPVLEKYREFEVHAPLSYSTTASDKAAAEVIESNGQSRFGERFVAHKEFLPFDEYVRLMGGCAVFVFAHRRQQSCGNIGIALRMGGCVIMDERNPVFNHVRRNGITVYSLSDLRLQGLAWILDDFRPRQLENIKKAKELWDYDRMMDEIKLSVRCLQSQIEGKIVGN